VRGTLSPYHTYIDTCASYSSTPYPELLSNLKKQASGLIGHSNAGPCGMDSSGSLGALEQVWLNEGGVVTIIPLKQLEKLCPWYTIPPTMGVPLSVAPTMVKSCPRTRRRACPTLTSGSSRPKQFYPLRPKRLCPLCRRCEGTWRIHQA